MSAGIFSDVRLGGRPRRKSGGRVELRPHEPYFFPLYERWYADPEIWNLSSWRENPMRPAETRRLFESRGRSSAERSYAIHVAGSKDDAPIGVIGLMNLTNSDASADLSIIIGDASERGYGYGSEAICRMLDVGFDELELERVALSVFDFNASAIKTYERLGFQENGRLKRAIRRKDGFHDAILMSVSREVWERRKNSPTENS